MSGVPDPWTLPGLRGWLDAVRRQLDFGVAVVAADTLRPPGMSAALESADVRPTVRAVALPGATPAAILADAFGTAETLDALLTPSLDGETAFVTFGPDPDTAAAGWQVFITRFRAARASGRPGPALLLVDAPPAFDASPPVGVPRWHEMLGRGDLVIWAEQNQPPARPRLAADLAVALATQLCGWRIDLGAALMRAGWADLADPLVWLARRTEAPAGRQDGGCPLAALRDGHRDRLVRLVWQAQLSVIFPELENRRLALVERFRPRLTIDAHLSALGVRDVDEIELGALQWQLGKLLTRGEANGLAAMARIRNALAHRKPAAAADLTDVFAS